MKVTNNNFLFYFIIFFCFYSCSNSIKEESQDFSDSITPIASLNENFENIQKTDSSITISPKESNSCRISPLDFLVLKDEHIQKDFFLNLDSVLAKQYSNEEYNDTLTVDLTPEYLNKFLADLNTDSLRLNKRFEYYYHFNIAPSEYSDPPQCKDGIHLKYIEDNCSFRLTISNTFLVEPNWCVESAVVYYFTIQNGKITHLSRLLAG